MTTIECTKCGDPVEVTARTVALPFVCELCEQTVENLNAVVKNPDVQSALAEQDKYIDQSEVDQFYEDMAPDAVCPCATCSPAVPNYVSPFSSFAYNGATAKWEPVTESDVTEEFATVENTTALIADLEAQLAAVTKQVAYLEARNKQLQDDSENQTDAFRRQFDTLRQRLGTNSLSSADSCVTLARIWQLCANERGRVTFYKKECEYLRGRLSEERNKSLWQQIKEHTFDRIG